MSNYECIVRNKIRRRDGQRQSLERVVRSPLDPHNLCPNRSPKAAASALKDIIYNKTVCELGCAEGDFMVFMSQYARSVVGFEYSHKRGDVAVNRGLDVTFGDYFEDELPEAEVYYVWPDQGLTDTSFLLARVKMKRAIFISGSDGEPKLGSQRENIENMVNRFNGRAIGVEYNEGDWDRASGIFYMGIFNEDLS